ncbi:MAG: hypothetical protein RAK22_03030 [Nanoarchaeota archaeon]|nr:hypothetical protein [Nanoarchaeota archaeon]
MRCDEETLGNDYVHYDEMMYHVTWAKRKLEDYGYKVRIYKDPDCRGAVIEIKLKCDRRSGYCDIAGILWVLSFGRDWTYSVQLFYDKMIVFLTIDKIDDENRKTLNVKRRPFRDKIDAFKKWIKKWKAELVFDAVLIIILTTEVLVAYYLIK